MSKNHRSALSKRVSAVSKLNLSATNILNALERNRMAKSIPWSMSSLFKVGSALVHNERTIKRIIKERNTQKIHRHFFECDLRLTKIVRKFLKRSKLPWSLINAFRFSTVHQYNVSHGSSMMKWKEKNEYSRIRFKCMDL